MTTRPDYRTIRLVIAAVGETLAEERAHRIALEREVATLKAEIERLAATRDAQKIKPTPIGPLRSIT